MPARSTSITIENHTSHDFVSGSGGLAHGEWNSNIPGVIPKGQSANIGAESNGFMTGDEGVVNYKCDKGDLAFNFDNPFIGSPSYGASGPDSFNISTRGGEEDQSHVTYTVTEKLGHGHK
ncbi:Crystal ET79 [Fusarium pseudocircinatum]|uniref:Crystal ET79 n=1 Tax=Fusarium pseudocircinatum TaxID=56676 RepID=A0A8H5PTR6_9HYPO|nr:Crystal ET79 [Fusarium pseudocircinatum]